MPVTINGTTGIAGPDGSASTPAVQGTDSNTGLFYPAADTVALSTGGSERMRIDSSGNVGVGTASPNTAGYGGPVLGVYGASNNGGNIWLTSDTTSSGNRAGRIGFGTEGNSSNKEIARVWSTTAGSTAGNLGGDLLFNTKADGGSLTERMRIDSSGNVGIGTSSPLARLTVSDSTATNGTMTLGNNASYNGTLQYIFSTGELRISQVGGASLGTTFYTASTERLRIDSGGNLLVGTTTNNASGGVIQVSNGITFPATQSASSDANTLDDYEEGTWTPSIGGTATYTARTGTYRKIGSQVTCWFDVTINAVGTGSGALQGLPFANNASAAGGGNVGYFASLVASFVMINPIVAGGQTSVSFETATAATATIGDNQNIWQNGSRCTGFVTYHV